MSRLALVSLLFLSCPAFAAEPLDGLEKDINKALKSHGVPGLAIAVVKDGKVILARGYGVKEIGKPEPVTEKSLFAIGSVTKSFTVALVAMLVDEKKLTWDDPLRKHLPEFQMSDRFYSDELTIRDCLNHRVGLARNELLWYGSPFNRDEILHRVRLLKIDARIRTQFIYNNILYLAVGQAAAAAVGNSWDNLIAKRLFKPLGMTTANTSIRKFEKDGDIAMPHTKIKGKTIRIDWRNIDNIGPAGSINASAADMAEYVKFQLGTGKFGDKRLIERDTFAAMHAPIMVLPKPPIDLNAEAKLRAYAMGWFVSDFHGSPLIEHGGNIDGMTASVMLMPEKKLGIVCLANLNGSALPMALNYDILERLLGEEPQNRTETSRLLTFLGEQSIQAATEPSPSSRVKETKPTFDLKEYAGQYVDTVLAPVTVTLEDGQLKLAFNTFRYELEHWHYDTFLGTDTTHALPKVLFTFDQSSEGKVGAIRCKPLVTEEFRFRKVK